jgi:FdhD protein
VATPAERDDVTVRDRVAIASVRRLDGRGQPADQDLVAVEAPLVIRVHQAGRATPLRLGVLMRTPGDDEDLVAGLLHGEGLVAQRDDLEALTIVDATPTADDREASDVADVTVAAGVDLDHLAAERHQVMTSACGLCGRLELQALARPRGAASGTLIRAETLALMPGQLRAGQPVFDETGGLHAAGLFTLEGVPRVLAEDVGRHNAVDKVVGAAWRGEWLHDEPLSLAVSGRVAFEIVQKAAVAGVHAIVAIGAPSSLAVRAARAAGLTLVGFARPGRANVYTGTARVAE